MAPTAFFYPSAAQTQRPIFPEHKSEDDGFPTKNDIIYLSEYLQPHTLEPSLFKRP